MENNRISRRSGLFAALVVLASLAVAAGVFTVARRGLLPGDSRPAPQHYQDQLTSEIRGPDANRNGIRDDVETWIARQFPEGAPERKAYLQLAADYQSVLLTTSNAKESVHNLRTLAVSIGCLRYVLGSDAAVQIAQFKAVVLDSDIRVRAWLKAYDRLKDVGIEASSTPSASNCRFSM